MIKLKLSLATNKRDVDREIVPQETLSNAVDRNLKGLLREGIKSENHFVAVVNGHIIPPDAWKCLCLKSEDNVLIAPKITDGDTGTLFKTAIIIVVAYYTGGAVGPGGIIGGATGLGVGGAFIVAGATIATTLLLNAMIPPPVPAGLDTGLGGDLSGSQMYSIGGQSNQAKQYGTVSKLYGTFRIFPAIAASPYAELETDPSSGSAQIQYFYCVYDFGLGPMEVKKIKIGDTPIEDFTDVQYRLVDFNKPAVSEGTWDDHTVNKLSFYKGKIEQDTVAVAINKNFGDLGAVLSDYQVVRNAAPNTTGVEQEITATLVCPSGLFALSNSGEFGTRTIFLTIEFSKVGEDIWKAFNDPLYVSAHSNTGGSATYAKTPMDLMPPGYPELGFPSLFGDFHTIYTDDAGPYYPPTTTAVYSNIPNQRVGADNTNVSMTQYFGLLKGTNKIYARNDPSFVGRAVRIRGEFVGYIQSNDGALPGTLTLWNQYTLDRPLAKNFSLWKLFFYKSIFGGNLIRHTDDIDFHEHNEDVTTLDKVTVENFALGKTQVAAATPQPFYSTFKFTPKENADYKIRITRTQSFSNFHQSVQDKLSWTAVSTRFNQDPIVTTKRHTFLEIKIKATNQLNGTIQNLSAECCSVLDTWNGSAWVKRPTANPAWTYVDILTGEVNKRALDKSRLDIDSIYEWATFCETVPTPPTGMEYVLPRFQTNLVVDYSPTLQNLVTTITAAAQASMNMVDGKYGILIDKLRTTPVQIFTTRNSSGFSSTRNYTLRPHALKVTYIDPAANWEPREAIVYDTGYNINTATDFDEVTSFACTNYEQAWRFGRYLLFQNRLRQEVISLTVDFENLVCTRGDFVQIAQDVMKVGGTPARVKSISGIRIVIDNAIETLPVSYGYTYRAITGEIRTNTLTVISADTFDLAGSPLPQVGDLIVIGEVGQIVIDCLVKSIQPSSDLSATLTLIEKADAVYTAESSDTVPDYEPQISDTANAEFDPPGEVQNLEIADSTFECTGAGLDYVVDLIWDVPSGAAYDVFEIYVDFGKGFSLVATTKRAAYTYTAEDANLGLDHHFKVLAVSAAGKKLDLGSVGEVDTTIERKTSPPSDVAALNIDVTGETVQLFWQDIPDCACREYLIRYSPDTDGTWNKSIPLLRVSNKTTTASTQARTGSYFIKAIDFEDNESLNAAEAITTIPSLTNLNIIDTTTDFPALLGVKNQVETLAGGLILASAVVGDADTNQFYDSGYYYYRNLLDLGDIFTVRLQSQIKAEGYTIGDLMSNWLTLSSVDAMSHAGVSDWDVETQYRTTNTFNVMADWATLSIINPISEGVQANWTAWKKFNMGDATGRIFQFRLKLISNKVSVTPRVFDGTIRSDMPDRVESYNNLAVPNTGLSVVYSPGFKGPGTTPNIQVSIDGASSGDYWTFTSKTLDGFTILVKDKTDVAVARSIDVAIKGYGKKATAVI